MFWKKNKKKPASIVTNIQTKIEDSKFRGETYFCTPVNNTREFEEIKRMCDKMGYKFVVDHITDNVIHYRISGWD